MIRFEQRTLSNGLKVIVEEDMSTTMVAVNVAYDVGSRDEDESMTGFAHLFEHLMFSGSKNIKDFDTVIQDAGGESNAYTNADLTNFYVVLPAINLETALWLESDRMMSLSINKKNLKTQQKVVIEEFKETCLNEPYGDMWHHLSELCYKVHPYKWPTIGREISHIADATIEDVKAFHSKYYTASNATLVISGGIETDKAFTLAQKWFEEIPSSTKNYRLLPVEPQQQEIRSKTVINSNLPSDAIYMAFHISSRYDSKYHTFDLLTDVLAEGRSSRFYNRLLKEKQMFNTIDAFISGSTDPGLMIIEAKLMPGVSIDAAQDVIWKELEDVSTTLITEDELTKLKNNVESSIAFSDVSILNKALSLAYFDMLGEPNMINTEAEKYNAITASDIRQLANETFKRDNVSILIYQTK